MALVSELDDLLVEARSGNRRSLSRLLTLVEEGHNSPIENIFPVHRSARDNTPCPDQKDDGGRL